MSAERITALDALIAAVEAGDWDTKTANAALPPSGVIGNSWFSYLGEARQASNGSLDAAKVLHEALLPGWEWHSLSNNGVSLRGPWSDDPNDPDASGYLYQDAKMPGHPARAWLIAILRALIAEARK